MPRQRPRRWLVPIAFTAFVILVALGVYMAAYYVMLDGERLIGRADERWPPAWWYYEKFTVEPTYRNDSDIIYILFWPAHQLDRMLRPSRWPFYGWLESASEFA